MTKEQALTSKYGTLMTLVHLAQELHRSSDGLRISLRTNVGWAGQVNAARENSGGECILIPQKSRKSLSK